MLKPNNITPPWIWPSVLILSACVAASSIALVSRLDDYVMDDIGAISLLREADQDTEAIETPPSSEEQSTSPESNVPGSTSQESTAPEPPLESDAATTPARPPSKPGFEVGDAQTVWSTDTQVEIFRISYENGERVVTVQSADGGKVIAPGTENSYIFKLKNTGNVALDYIVEVDAYFTPADIKIPILARLSRYDGHWLVGGTDEYVEAATLDTAEEKAVLGAGKYTYYTLDWVWPFEGGNDELDTQLGNLAAEQDLVFTIVIRTTATESANPNDDGGITPPQTGDDTVLWAVLVACSFSMILILLFGRKKRTIVR